MRALLVGLVGVVLAGGAAEAASCPITEATVTIKDTKQEYGNVVKVGRPDLVGQTFRVARYTSHREMVRSPTGTDKRLGYEGYELVGLNEALTVKRDYVDGSPAVTPLSWMSGSQSNYGPMEWGGGRPERVQVGQDLDYFLDGPLSALTAQVTSCR